MTNLEIWDKLKQPPKTALKEIKGGRLKGMTDINPQWRYKAMTEQFGPCGVGWRYEIKEMWKEAGSDDQFFAFAEVKVYIKVGDIWSAGIPGIGGSMLVTKEKNGLYSSDEGYKMAVTDALSVALKMIGVASEIYEGRFDGKVFVGDDNDTPKPITKDQCDAIIVLARQNWDQTEKEAIAIMDWYCKKSGKTYLSGKEMMDDFGSVLEMFLVEKYKE